MRIIDIHTHIYPQEIANKAAKSIRDFYEIDGADMSGTAQLLLERGRAAGISQYAVLPVGIRPDRVCGINDFIMEQAAQHPEFIPCGTVHAAMENLEEETQRILDMGMHAVKMHPDSQRFPIDDPRLYPVYDAVQDKIPVMLHMGDPRYNFSHPVRLRRVMDTFPRLQVIAAHFGGYQMFDIAKEQLYATNCIFDVSSAMMFMEPGEAERYINIYGAERMAYGTDYPLWDPVEEVKRFQSLKLTADQFDQIAHRTAERVLGL